GGRIADIRGHDQRARARGRLRGGLVEALPSPSGERDPVAFREQRERGSPADATARTGHDGDAAARVRGHDVPAAPSRNSPLSSSNETAPSRPAKLPSFAIAVAARMNPDHAARASAAPTLTRRTPSA